MISPATDLELIQRLLGGEQAAFGILDGRYRNRLATFLRGRMQLSSEEAEDVVQDVFTALVANDCSALRRFAGRSSLYTYLCAIALRRVYRLRKRQLPVLDAAAEDLPEPSVDSTEQDLTATAVQDALKQLPDSFRVPLTLHYFSGLEYHEIATMLDVPPNTVATRICRAKRRLREILSG